MAHAVLLFVGVLTIINGVFSQTADTNGELDECNSPDDPRLAMTCEVTSLQTSGMACRVLGGGRCGGRDYGGEGTLCLAGDVLHEDGQVAGRGHNATHPVLRCSQGLWTVTRADAMELERLHREKRFLGVLKKIGRFISDTVRTIVCYFLCRSGPPPNKFPSFNYCPSVAPQTADPGRLDTVVTWSSPTATDKEDGKMVIGKGVSKVSGPGPGSRFPGGNTAVLYKARDSRGAQDFCVINVQVNVVQCSPVQPLLHGTQTCNGMRSNVYGSKCTHTCDKGYNLAGSRDVTCQDDRSWSSSFPSCQPVSCGSPGSVAGGTVTCPRGHVFPEMCLLTCQLGFTHTGAPYAVCGDTGAWSSILPCKDTQAPSFPGGCPPNQQLTSGPLGDDVRVTWADPQTADNGGGSVSVTNSVVKGSGLGPGFHVIRITATDAASNAASCSFVVTVTEGTCPSLEAPRHGRVQCSHGHLEDSQCQVTCDAGHELQGDPSLTCLANQQWNASTPTCQEISCPMPAAVSNGLWNCYAGHTFQAACLLTCDQGFTLQGLPFAYCQANATWSNTASVCVDSEPPTFVNTPCQDNMDVDANRLGQTTQVTWSSPPTRDNSGGLVTVTSDVAPGSAFPVGVTRVTLTATDPDGNPAMCSFTVTVTSLTCGAPDLEAANRARTVMTYACPDGHVFGATCLLNCSYGFPLLGAANVTCEADTTVFPPAMDWVWPDPHLGKPVCRENNCTDLAPPRNGALACFPTGFAKMCQMSCNAAWDLPGLLANNGQFICANSNNQWIPGSAPDCTERMRPGSVHIMASVFYYTGSCASSTAALQQAFIDRLSTSSYKDACVNVPQCVPQNVQVTCGAVSAAGRKKREADSTKGNNNFSEPGHTIHKRQTQSHYVVIKFEIAVPYDEGAKSPDQAHQEYKSLATNIYNRLQTDADGGQFNIEGLVTDSSGLDGPTMDVTCPPGTRFHQTVSSSKFSCTGCGAGWFLGAGQKACTACAVGSFAGLDSATVCTRCPDGWSTPDNASTSLNQCQELCRPGYFSPSGFAPCQACPPGQYQASSGAKACTQCPASSWTLTTPAVALDNCTDADVRLTNRTLAASVSGPWTSLTVSVWLRLAANSRVTACLEGLGAGGGPVAACAVLYTDSALAPADTRANTSAIETEPEAWTSVQWSIQPGSSAANVQLLHKGGAVMAFPYNITSNSTAVLRITADENITLVSGLRADTPALTPGVMTQSQASCTGDASSNVMRWTPTPRTLFLPSQCDAVDECLSSPCGAQGTCHNGQGGFTCTCRGGWSGATCSTPPDACHDHACHNHATCLSGPANYTCLCQRDFSGDRCELIKEHGAWGSWAPWSACTAQCNGSHTRQRHCNNPAPSNGGDNCSGNDTEAAACGDPVCAVDGGWGAWGAWSTCSATCGAAERRRVRMCDSPAPQDGGAACTGATEERDTCTTQPCPVDGGWGLWAAWGACSATCGGGQQARGRSCDTPTPASGGSDCAGHRNQTRACANVTCPECQALARPRGGMLSCADVTAQAFQRTCNVTCLPGYVAPPGLTPYTCGAESGYVWNHQRDHDTPAPPLPACTRPYGMGGVRVVQEVTMNVGCDANNPTTVRSAVAGNLLLGLPCAVSGTCTTSVSAACAPQTSGRRRRRSVNPLQLQVAIDFDFGASMEIDANDTTQVASYAQMVQSADASLVMALKNGTDALYSVRQAGAVLAAPVDSNFTININCPPGTTASDGFCVRCSAGSHEEGGKCVSCPVGQYQPESGQTSCLPCPDGLGYDVAGASDVSLCLFPVPVESKVDSSSSTSAGSGDDETGLVAGVMGGLAAAALLVAAVLVYLKLKKAKKPGEKPWPYRPSSAASFWRPASAQSRVWPEGSSGRATPSAVHTALHADPSILKDGAPTSLPPINDGPPSLPPLTTAGNAWVLKGTALPPIPNY